MFQGNYRVSLVLLLSLCTGPGLSKPICGAEPKQSTNESQAAFTHVITAETVYYTTGPQQGRPPDGKFPAGTKVQVLRESGSYSQVRTETETIAYVSTSALKKVEGTKPVLITDKARAVAQESNRFAFDLYNRLREQEGDLFLSPASISAALAMTYAGAVGETEKQMARVLHFNLPKAKLHAGYGTLTEILNSQQPGYRLNMANRLWAQKGYPFQPEFLTLTRDRYGAELAPVDFARQTEQARLAINAWVEEQTQGKIEDLIASGDLDAMTRLVLTNAIYFKGAWAKEFTKDATKDAAFHLSSDRRIMTPLMHQTDDFLYAAKDDLQILELPYAGGDLSMVILLPKQVDGLARLESQLTAEKVQQWTSDLRQRQVQVSLPKFKLTSRFYLSEVLQSLGLTLPFSPQADFSGISTAEDLMISEVIHKAFVDVNEEGTEAAAATAVTIRVTAAPIVQEPVVFRADRPFLFFLRDNRTQAVLFLGRLTNPQE